MNVLYIADTERAARNAAIAVTPFDVVPMHHTISSFGMREEIAKAKREHKCLMLEQVSEFPLASLEYLASNITDDFDVIAYTTQCPCGKYFGECHCTQSQIAKWENRLPESFKALFVIKQKKGVEE